MLQRIINLPPSPEESFFLWGPRQTGKSSLLKSLYLGKNNVKYIDLLKSEILVSYTNHPEHLREELALEINPNLVIIDEIQKVPALLNEIHWLIENTDHIFVLCGSSARKLKRGQANLLGGRALRYELFCFVYPEIKHIFDLENVINNGLIPRHFLGKSAKLKIRSYVTDYLKEEIVEEGLVRNLPVFSDFLHKASFLDSEQINFSNIARECSISSHTVKEYFQILEDTLLGQFLNAYTRRPKRRIIKAPKFYFFDVGIVNYLAKRGKLSTGSELFGKAFENWIFHELNAYKHYSELFFDISYWRLTSGIEVDFILNDMEIAIEVKAVEKIRSHHLKGLRNLIEDHPKVKKRYLVCLENRARQTEDGIIILPYQQFVEKLWKNSIIN